MTAPTSGLAGGTTTLAGMIGHAVRQTHMPGFINGHFRDRGMAAHVNELTARAASLHWRCLKPAQAWFMSRTSTRNGRYRLPAGSMRRAIPWSPESQRLSA